MTREEKLFAMRMTELVAEAERLGVKIDKKGRKDKAVARILAFEAEQAQAVADAEEQTADDTTCGDGTPFTEVMQEIVAGAEQKAEKKARKARQSKRTFEELLADIPVRAGLIYRRLKGNRVGIVEGNKRLLAVGNSRHGYTVITNKFSRLAGIPVEFKKTADGRDAVFTDISAEDMIKVMTYVVG